MNYLAIVLCGVAAMIIGSVWHGPLFGKTTMRLMGSDTMTPEQKNAMRKSMGGMYVLQFIISFITAAVLSYVIIHWTGRATSVIIAIYAWFGFIMTTTAGGALWSGKSKDDSWKMFLIGAGGQLVTFISYGLILGMWK